MQMQDEAEREWPLIAGVQIVECCPVPGELGL